LNVKFKLIHKNSKLPKQKVGYAGWDIIAVNSGDIFPSEIGTINTGLVLADTPFSYTTGGLSMLKIEGKFGIARKGVFPISGIIDPYYREEIKVLLYNSYLSVFSYEPGDIIAKIVCYPVHSNNADGKVSIIESNTVNKI